MIRTRLKEIYEFQNESWPEFLLLGHCWAKPVTKNMPISPIKGFACTHAYALSLKTAQMLLVYSRNAGFKAIDLIMSSAISEEVPGARGLWPPIVHQLPRAYLNDDSISGSTELPRQDLKHPLLQSTKHYSRYVIDESLYVKTPIQIQFELMMDESKDDFNS